jgi:hypothetical protein
MANLLSFIFLLCFLWGRTLARKNLRLHITVMLTVMCADLCLVGSLVIMRDALNKVSTDMPWTLQVHVPIAITTVILYFATAWTGYMLYRGRPVRAHLQWFDRSLTTARILTFVTSLMVQFIHA